MDRAVGAGKEGRGWASPKELRLVWYQNQGDPAYRGVVPWTLARAGLSGPRRVKQEPLLGKGGGQVGVWVRAPRAVMLYSLPI